MNTQNKYDQFFEQIKDKSITKDLMINAIKAVGHTPELKPFYLAYAKANGIDIDRELDDLINAQETAQQNKAIKETAETLAEKSGALTTETDPEKQKELIEGIRRLAASMGEPAQSTSRFYTAADYVNECKNYDPSKDFTSSTLAGLRFPNGTLSYIGARPGGGKSTLLVNLAREAITSGRNVILVNLEMINRAVITNYVLSLMYSTAEEEQRKVLDTIDHPMNKYYSLFQQEYDNREIFDALRQKAMQNTLQLLEKNLFLYDGAGQTVETITREIESMVNAGDIVLIDYLQRILPPKEEQRYIQIKQVSNALLTLALKSNVVIISGAQFGRQKQDRIGNEATLEDFREGGDIEQDAHNALAIETIIDKDGNDAGRYIHVLKQREGGAIFKRVSLDCQFDYLYMAGTNKEYITEKSERSCAGEKKDKAIKNYKQRTNEQHCQTLGGIEVA